MKKIKLKNNEYSCKIYKKKTHKCCLCNQCYVIDLYEKKSLFNRLVYTSFYNSSLYDVSKEEICKEMFKNTINDYLAHKKIKEKLI